MSEPVDDFLMHYGVKGMKWGKKAPKTRTEEIDDRLKKLERKRDKKDGQKIVDGAELRGWAINKGAKNPSRRAKTSVALRGTAEVAGILVAGNLALNAANLHPNTTSKGRIAVAGLAVTAARSRVSQIRAVNEFDSHRAIVDEIATLQKERKTLTKGTK